MEEANQGTGSGTASGLAGRSVGMVERTSTRRWMRWSGSSQGATCRQTRSSLAVGGWLVGQGLESVTRSQRGDGAQEAGQVRKDRIQGLNAALDAMERELSGAVCRKTRSCLAIDRWDTGWKVSGADWGQEVGQGGASGQVSEDGDNCLSGASDAMSASSHVRSARRHATAWRLVSGTRAGGCNR